MPLLELLVLFLLSATDALMIHHRPKLSRSLRYELNLGVDFMILRREETKDPVLKSFGVESTILLTEQHVCGEDRGKRNLHIALIILSANRTANQA